MRQVRHFSSSLRGYQKLSNLPKSLQKHVKWKPVVGLEVHAQIQTKSKLFSGAPASFGGPVNDQVAFFDAAIPGTLPVLNKDCVELGVKTAIALGCRVNRVSTFDRKHYFYADLPSGYQITQQNLPLAYGGVLNFTVFTPGVHKVPYSKSSTLTQLQLEQDSGKTLNDEDNGMSLIDLNRAGVPLMELVFEPDLSDGEEAAALVKELSLILTRIGSCSCRMQEGGLRVDANVSVERAGSSERGTRTEVKNIGSIRGVAKAVDFEIKRQIELLSRGDVIVNETRAWDSENGITLPMRDKEVNQDYRFMPEPNLPPVRLSEEDIAKVSLPELPAQTRERLLKDYGLSALLIVQLVNDVKLLSYFTEVASRPSCSPKTLANLLVMDLMTLVNDGVADLDSDLPLPDHLGEIVDLVSSKEVSHVTARNLLKIACQSSTLTPREVVVKEGWSQITDSEKLTTICLEVIDANPDAVGKYRAGKKKIFQFFVGSVAQRTNNRADLDTCSKILKDILESNKT